jgi:hypothetical protein
MRGEWLIPPRPVPSVVFYVHGGGFVSCSATTHRPIAAALARLTRRAVVSVDYRLAPEARLPAAHEDITAAFELVVASGTPSSEIALVGDSAGGNLVLSLAVRLRDQGAGAVACMSVLLKLLDDAKRVQEQIHRVGGECSLRVYEDVPHCWQVLFPLMPEAIESLQDTATFIDASLADTGGRTVLPYARCSGQTASQDCSLRSLYWTRLQLHLSVIRPERTQRIAWSRRFGNRTLLCVRGTWHAPPKALAEVTQSRTIERAACECDRRAGSRHNRPGGRHGST